MPGKSLRYCRGHVSLPGIILIFKPVENASFKPRHRMGNKQGSRVNMPGRFIQPGFRGLEFYYVKGGIINRCTALIGSMQSKTR